LFWRDTQPALLKILSFDNESNANKISIVTVDEKVLHFYLLVIYQLLIWNPRIKFWIRAFVQKLKIYKQWKNEKNYLVKNFFLDIFFWALIMPWLLASSNFSFLTVKFKIEKCFFVKFIYINKISRTDLDIQKKINKNAFSTQTHQL
jgi:hypothetical protein